MKLPETYICDGCGTRRGETNHWWFLEAFKDDYGVSLMIAPWSEALAESLADNKGVKHACGNNCAQKLVERYLQTRTLETARVVGEGA